MESNKCVMVAKAADAGLKEEGGEDEVELDLGLSIGGSYRRPAERVVCVQNGSVSGLQENVEREMDQRMKREIHALRRQEAKRKREEKQLKRSLSCKTKGNGFEAESFQRESKKSKSEDHSGSDDHCRQKNPVNLNLGLPVPYPNAYPPLQHGPAANGSLDENVMMTCWLPAGAAGIGQGRNVLQPVLRFGPLNKAGSVPGCNSGNRYEAEHIRSRDAGSNGSSNLCTSSAGSDRKSSSFEGGGSSDSRSYSGQSVPEQPQPNASIANHANCRPDHTVTSHLKGLARVNGATSHVDQSSPSGPGERTKPEKIPADNHTSAVENPAVGLLKDPNGSMSKPPKPQAPNQITPSLPHMPCVSTTGNGPNGKTINGFLYRYTKSEVSIICVCHGSSFSPAEFVQHAGGTDVSHPLRHITVIPSAF